MRGNIETYGSIITQRAVFLLLALAFLSATFFCLFADIREIVTIVSDDSGYFLEIAENAAGGAGFTFDGIGHTNGYQPLWLYLLTALQAIISGNPETMLRACVLFQAVLLFSAGVLFYRIHSGAFSRKCGLISVIAFLVFVFFPCLNGMESALLVFMLAFLLYTGWKGRIFSTSPGGWHFLFGIVLGLTVLARLDAVFIATTLAFYLTFDIIRGRTDTSVKIKRLVLIAAGSALVLTPYMLYNLITTGSIMPISGALKSTFPHISTSGYGLSRLSQRDWGKISAAALYLVWYLRSGRERGHREREYFRGAVAILGVAVLLHSLHTALFMKWAVFRWHFITYSVLGTFVLSEPVEFILPNLPRRFLRIAWPATLLVLLVTGALIIRGKMYRPYDWTVQSYEASLWAKNNTGPDDIFAMKDAGIFGFFSERQVVNLDGVVNNTQFQKVLKEGRLDEYLGSCNVQYIAQHAIWHRNDVVTGEYTTYSQEYPSRKFNGSGDVLELTRDSEVYRSPIYFDGAFDTVFLIWRFRQQ